MSEKDLANIEAAAAQLAMSGDHHSALALIDSIGADESSSALLLLKAKILAQLKSYDGAIETWRAVLEEDPQNGEALAGIKRAEQLLRHPGAFRGWSRLFWVPLFLLLLLLLAAFGIGRLTTGGSGTDGATLIALRSDQQKLADQLGELKQQISDALTPRHDPPPLTLDLEGVRIEPRGERVRAVFQEGLFTAGKAELTADAMALLNRLGQQLEPQAGGIAIHVIGLGDDIPLPPYSPYRDNQALRLDRARVVIEYLRENASLPSAIFTAAAGGPADVPFPGTGRKSEPRNRSAVIEISALPAQ